MTAYNFFFTSGANHGGHAKSSSNFYRYFILFKRCISEQSRCESLHTGVQFKKKCVCIVKHGFHPSRTTMQKHTKQGFVSLVIPGHDPPLDITVYVDISTNPGPAQSTTTIGGRRNGLFYSRSSERMEFLNIEGNGLEVLLKHHQIQAEANILQKGVIFPPRKFFTFE